VVAAEACKFEQERQLLDLLGRLPSWVVLRLPASTQRRSRVPAASNYQVALLKLAAAATYHYLVAAGSSVAATSLSQQGLLTTAVLGACASKVGLCTEPKVRPVMCPWHQLQG